MAKKINNNFTYISPWFSGELSLEKKPLWMKRIWYDRDGLVHTMTYDFVTEIYSEEWHPQRSHVAEEVMPNAKEDDNKP